MERIKGAAIFGAYWFVASALVAACWAFVWATMERTAVIQNWPAAIIGDLIAGFLFGGLFWGMTTVPKTATKPFHFAFGAWWIGFAVLIGTMSHPHGVGQYGLVAVISQFFAILVWGVINGRYERARAIAESDSRKVLAVRLQNAIMDRCKMLEHTVGFDHMNVVVAGVYNGAGFVARNGSTSSRDYWHGVVDGRKFLREMPENEFLIPMDAAFSMLIADNFDEALVAAAITKI